VTSIKSYVKLETRANYASAGRLGLCALTARRIVVGIAAQSHCAPYFDIRGALPPTPVVPRAAAPPLEPETQLHLPPHGAPADLTHTATSSDEFASQLPCAN